MKYYETLIAISICAMLILVVMIKKHILLPKRYKVGAITAALLIIAAASCEYFGTVLNGAEVQYRSLHIFVKFVELSIAPVIPIAYGIALHPVKHLRRLILPLVLHLVIEFLSIWFGIVFYVTADNIYVHSTFYAIYYIAYFLGTVFLVCQTWWLSRRYQNPNRNNLLLILLFVFWGILTEAIDSSLKVVWLSVTIGVILFHTLYSDMISQTDALTELLDRRAYEIKLLHQTKRAVILFADVDEFKIVNDSYGHQFGDFCLTEIGKQMKKVYGRYGLCYRIGGDEFCVILERQLDEVQRLNTDFFHALEKSRETEARIPYVSIGYTPFIPGQMDILESVKKADQIMYETKKKNKSVSTRRSSHT